LKIEILYFDGCPNHLPAVERVREVLQAMNLPDAPIEVRISDPAMAAPLRFLGSPTIQINGLDIEPSARNSDQFGFGCRTYFSQGRRSGLPSKELVRNALDEAAAAVRFTG
jgi:hypothetical protein